MKPSPFILSILLLWTLYSCQSGSEENTQEAPKSGEALSKLYCVSCHQYPKPELLDKATWEHYILPRMGYMFGIFPDEKTRNELFEANAGGDIVRKAGLFPKQPTIDSADWEKIKAFYLELAPDRLPLPEKKTIAKSLKQFKTVIPPTKMSPPSTTMVRFNEKGEIYLGDANTQSLLHLNSDLSLIKAGKVREGAVWLEEQEDGLWVTVMGSFSPTDEPKGMVLVLPNAPGTPPIIPIKNLQRPVHSAYADLDGDGLKDIVVCEFGKWTGALSWFRNLGGYRYEKQVLWNKPGATKAYIQDMNQDQKPDIVALFGQGDEGIDIYYNQGAGQFKRERVISFPSTYGSSFMTLQDFNGDQHLDILYCAGDNGDYNPVMKPFHGVYIFMNDGKNQFQQDFFYQLNGAYNAVAEDFDEDGDRDIAVISFFPDFQNSPEESFVYLENDGQNDFSPSTFDEVNKGRWIVMDAADYDKDGDLDLVLGALTFEVVPKLGYVEQWVKEGIPYVILENRQK